MIIYLRHPLTSGSWEWHLFEIQDANSRWLHNAGLCFYILKISELQRVCNFATRAEPSYPRFIPASSCLHTPIRWKSPVPQWEKSSVFLLSSVSFPSYIFYRQQRNFSYFTLNSAQQQSANKSKVSHRAEMKSAYSHTLVKPRVAHYCSET